MAGAIIICHVESCKGCTQTVSGYCNGCSSSVNGMTLHYCGYLMRKVASWFVGAEWMYDSQRLIDSAEAISDGAEAFPRRQEYRGEVVEPFLWSFSPANGQNEFIRVIDALGDQTLKGPATAYNNEVLHLYPRYKLVSCRKVRRRMWSRIAWTITTLHDLSLLCHISSSAAPLASVAGVNPTFLWYHEARRRFDRCGRLHTTYPRHSLVA
jgi:hypothetical protein